MLFRSQCIQSQTEWIPQWARSVRHANIALERCSLSRRHVNIDSSRDALALWWLPLTRVNGKPYTRYKATIAVDNRNC